MKQNSLEEKEKFYAQYWGQDVLYLPRTEQTWNISDFEDEDGKSIVEESYLLLTSIADISEEDAKVLSYNDYGKNNFEHILERDKETAKEHWLADYKAIGFHTQFDVDYLRSKGYLVPWGEYTCEDILNNGWAKIRNK